MGHTEIDFLFINLSHYFLFSYIQKLIKNKSKKNLSLYDIIKTLIIMTILVMKLLCTKAK